MSVDFYTKHTTTTAIWRFAQPRRYGRVTFLFHIAKQ